MFISACVCFNMLACDKFAAFCCTFYFSFLSRTIQFERSATKQPLLSYPDYGTSYCREADGDRNVSIPHLWDTHSLNPEANRILTSRHYRFLYLTPTCWIRKGTVSAAGLQKQTTCGRLQNSTVHGMNYTVCVTHLPEDDLMFC